MSNAVSVSYNQCSDKEDWCKHGPNCNFEDVQTSCPKHCEICKGIGIFFDSGASLNINEIS